MFNFLDLKGFYKGRLSLKKSFWLYFVVFYLFGFKFVLVLLYAVNFLSLGITELRVGGGSGYIWGVINLLVFYFVLVGTWRSASNLAGQTYQGKKIYVNVVWSWITKFFLICALVQFLYPYYLSTS